MRYSDRDSELPDEVVLFHRTMGFLKLLKRVGVSNVGRDIGRREESGEVTKNGGDIREFRALDEVGGGHEVDSEFVRAGTERIRHVAIRSADGDDSTPESSGFDIEVEILPGQMVQHDSHSIGNRRSDRREKVRRMIVEDVVRSKLLF